jgi:glutathione synthase
MVHQDGDNLQIKQVEFNTIASSFGGLSAQTSLLHKYDTRPLTAIKAANQSPDISPKPSIPS